MTGQKKREDVITVQILEAKPNKLFTEEQRAWVRFLRYSRAIPCAECGKRRRVHWTMLFSFEAKSMGFVVPVPGKGAHLPLTPVCASHLLAPAALVAPPARRKGHPRLMSP